MSYIWSKMTIFGASGYSRVVLSLSSCVKWDAIIHRKSTWQSFNIKAQCPLSMYSSTRFFLNYFVPMTRSCILSVCLLTRLDSDSWHQPQERSWKTQSEESRTSTTCQQQHISSDTKSNKPRYYFFVTTPGSPQKKKKKEEEKKRVLFLFFSNEEWAAQYQVWRQKLSLERGPQRMLLLLRIPERIRSRWLKSRGKLSGTILPKLGLLCSSGKMLKHVLYIFTVK